MYTWTLHITWKAIEVVLKGVDFNNRAASIEELGNVLKDMPLSVFLKYDVDAEMRICTESDSGEECTNQTTTEAIDIVPLISEHCLLSIIANAVLPKYRRVVDITETLLSLIENGATDMLCYNQVLEMYADNVCMKSYKNLKFIEHVLFKLLKLQNGAFRKSLSYLGMLLSKIDMYGDVFHLTRTDIINHHREIITNVYTMMLLDQMDFCDIPAVLFLHGKTPLCVPEKNKSFPINLELFMLANCNSDKRHLSMGRDNMALLCIKECLICHDYTIRVTGESTDDYDDVEADR